MSKQQRTIVGFFNAIDTVCIACATKRHKFLKQHDSQHAMHDYTQDSPLHLEDKEEYTCALCGQVFPSIAQKTPQKIIVGYTYDSAVFHTHCLSQGRQAEGKPVYLHQLGTRSALCYACCNGLVHDYSSALQASRSCLVKYFDNATPYNMPYASYRDAMQAFLVRLLSLAYARNACQTFYDLIRQERAENEQAMQAYDEDTVDVTISKSIVYDEIVRLYGLPYTVR